MTLQQALQTHLQEIVRDRNPFLSPQGHFYVREYIRQQFQQWGEVKTHGFEFRGNRYENLLLDLPGAPSAKPRKQPSEKQSILLIGAHFDTVPGSPGADDNASGVAVLLELAKAIAAHPARYPTRFVAFDLEEINLTGSRYYAQFLRQQGEVIRLMLSLEMLGYCDRTPNSQRYPPGLKYLYPNRGDFLGLIGNWQTIPDLIVLRRAIQSAGVACEWLPAGKRGLIVPDTRRSDHASFWDAGYKAILITDTANLRNPHYHQASDRLETLDFDFLTGICRGLMDAVGNIR